MTLFYGWGSRAKSLVLILSTSEGWTAESALDPPIGFEHGTPGLGIQRLNIRPSLNNFKDLQHTLQRVLDEHAPLKKRYVRANQQNFMGKILNQAIMFRSELRNKYLKSKPAIDKQRYYMRKNYCVKLLCHK